ncbi:MAG: hypothetical protein HYU66_16235, partial [Armatimonadetes bacterium]|nr:hypothetical protein [Armatimonadota bacterium]
MRLTVAALTASLAVAALAQPDLPRELAANGAFDTDANHDGFPDGFNGDHTGVGLVAENGNPFVRLASPGPGPASRSLSQALKLDPEWFKLRVSVRVRAAGIVPGVEGWHDARVAMDFHSADGTQVGGWPNVLHWTGATDGWQSFSRDYVIPEHAVELRISLSMFQCTGQVDYDDFSVKVIAHRPKPEDAVLPAGVVADWSLEHAWREETPSRGRVCLNGLWRFCPLMPGGAVGRPADGTGWGWLKVPAAWPGRRDECVTPIGPDIWDLSVDWAKVEEGWYEREFTVPAEWAGRRIGVSFDLPQTAAEVAVDGKPAGTVRWPAGEVDVTALVTPGATATLTVHVTTDPFSKERMVAMREDQIEQVKAQVVFRGLVGDVFLTVAPERARIAAVQTRPSVRHKALGLAVRLADLEPARRYHLHAAARQPGAEEWQGQSPAFSAADLKDGLFTCELPWERPHRWDFEQPSLYDLEVSLIAELAGPPATLDTFATRFGFRELWLDGRNLVLNGTPVHLRALDFSGISHDNAQASYAAVRRILGKTRSMGFNFIILANYGLEPGETCAFTDLLRAADELGFALSFSGPHAFQYAGSGTTLNADWQAAARYAVEVVGNHPSVLAYALNHNTLGYHGDQNPDKIDGLNDVVPSPADKGWPAQGWDERRARAAASEAFIRALDPTREVYHHQSGNCGAWHTVNIYLNWAPVQERSEWLRHWSSVGVKPLFFVEWGPPHSASWGGHRQGPFIWRNKVNSEPLAVEYGAMLTGDAAYRDDPVMARYVDNYEKVYARKQPFHISELFGPAWAASNELNYIELKSLYIRHNWPRLRTWGITALLPWDQGDVGYQSGPHPDRFERQTDWTKLQQPGYAPDFELFTGDWFHHPANIWLLSSLGEAYMRFNQPICSYLGGGPENFTEASHTVVAGERVSKQAILLNDTRQPLEATYRWSLSATGKAVASGEGKLSAPPGGQARGPFAVRVPAGATGELTLALDVTAAGQTQHDSLTLHVVQPARPAANLLAV